METTDNTRNPIKQYIIGIDAASHKFDVFWLKDTNKFTYRSKILPNNPSGCLKLPEWIHKNINTDLSTIVKYVHCCISLR